MYPSRTLMHSRNTHSRKPFFEDCFSSRVWFETKHLPLSHQILAAVYSAPRPLVIGAHDRGWLLFRLFRAHLCALIHRHDLQRAYATWFIQNSWISWQLTALAGTSCGSTDFVALLDPASCFALGCTDALASIVGGTFHFGPRLVPALGSVGCADGAAMGPNLVQLLQTPQATLIKLRGSQI
jgi:hypothetical protein